jgi:hypothetical protein
MHALTHIGVRVAVLFAQPTGHNFARREQSSPAIEDELQREREIHHRPVHGPIVPPHMKMLFAVD